MKLYAIHENHYSDKIVSYATSKNTVIEWLKCLDLITRARLNDGKYGFEQTWNSIEKALTKANVTKYRFITKSSTGYYVEEIHTI
jgi:hypothetical protein